MGEEWSVRELSAEGAYVLGECPTLVRSDDRKWAVTQDWSMCAWHSECCRRVGRKDVAVTFDVDCSTDDLGEVERRWIVSLSRHKAKRFRSGNRNQWRSRRRRVTCSERIAEHMSRSAALTLRLHPTAVITSSVAAGFGRHGMPPPVCNLDLWLFDLETGVRVASQVGNLHSKFGPARPLGVELFAMYATDGQTDRRTKATLFVPFPTVGAF